MKTYSIETKQKAQDMFINENIGFSDIAKEIGVSRRIVYENWAIKDWYTGEKCSWKSLRELLKVELKEQKKKGGHKSGQKNIKQITNKPTSEYSFQEYDTICGQDVDSCGQNDLIPYKLDTSQLTTIQQDSNTSLDYKDINGIREKARLLDSVRKSTQAVDRGISSVLAILEQELLNIQGEDKEEVAKEHAKITIEYLGSQEFRRMIQNQKDVISSLATLLKEPQKKVEVNKTQTLNIINDPDYAKFVDEETREKLEKLQRLLGNG